MTLAQVGNLICTGTSRFLSEIYIYTTNLFKHDIPATVMQESC